jgi:hypothetical protein
MRIAIKDLNCFGQKDVSIYTSGISSIQKTFRVPEKDGMGSSKMLCNTFGEVLAVIQTCEMLCGCKFKFLESRGCYKYWESVVPVHGDVKEVIP